MQVSLSECVVCLSWFSPKRVAKFSACTFCWPFWMRERRLLSISVRCFVRCSTDFNKACKPSYSCVYALQVHLPSLTAEMEKSQCCAYLTITCTNLNLLHAHIWPSFLHAQIWPSLGKNWGQDCKGRSGSQSKRGVRPDSALTLCLYVRVHVHVSYRMFMFLIKETAQLVCACSCSCSCYLKGAYICVYVFMLLFKEKLFWSLHVTIQWKQHLWW
jgi:hypothetical protein